jgi:hypothetical protein
MTCQTPVYGYVFKVLTFEVALLLLFDQQYLFRRLCHFDVNLYIVFPSNKITY